MAGAGGLAVILLAGLVAFLLCVGTFFGAGYALFGKDARRGYRVGVASVIATVVAILLSIPFWTIALTGRNSHGEPMVWSESGPILPLVVIEAVLLVTAIAGTLRQRARRVA